MKRVLCILNSGFEEIEAIAPVDLLRRAGVEVVMAGVSSMEITGKCEVTIKADVLLVNILGDDFDALFLPGGPLLLKDAGILNGKRITAHFSTAVELPEITGGHVEIDANLLTSRGAGTAIEFGLAFVALLAGEDAAEEVSRSIMA